MQRAMFLLESYKKGILAELDSGYIFTLNVPDMNDIQRKFDPYRLEMISYSGVKAINQLENGLEFTSAGRKILCLVEPTNYPKSYIEPSMRSNRTTEHIPFRFKECDIYSTHDRKYRVLLPTVPIECYDAFTVEFPSKGDICVLYFIFNENISEVVLPYIRQNIEMILKSVVNLQSTEAKKISTNFIENVKRFHVLA